MKKIIGLTFPKQDVFLGLEPSVLTVLPNGENVSYSMENSNFDDREVAYYVCSVYITGMNEFKNWAKNHDQTKIIVGGYEPTINPNDFLDCASKIITGPCDDLPETLKQNGKIVKGITNYKKIPRYELYDIRFNQQILPDKNPEDICTSVNTSQGCPLRCDFCCSPLMSDHLMQKPLKNVKLEIDYLKRFKPKYIFIRDENFPLQKDWKQKLMLVEQSGAKIYLFASANLLTEENIKFMKEHNVYMICLGLEDITQSYKKNKSLDEVCDMLHENGIYVYLSFIVNPLNVDTPYKSELFYNKLLNRFRELKPEMICGNFLMPFRGTKIWDTYKHLVTQEDFDLFDSKHAFLVKDKAKRAQIEYDMFFYQNKYFNSNFYNKNIRKFAVGDTLHNRFLELEDKFKNEKSNNHQREPEK